MPEKHPAEFGVGTTVRDEDRDYELEEISFGDRDAGEQGAEERKDPCRPGEPADKALASPENPLEVYRTGETEPFARLVGGPIAPWEKGYDRDARTPIHADRVEAGKAPPSLPDRGSGHAPGAAAQQQERSGLAR